jgi:hypothetical protein
MFQTPQNNSFHRTVPPRKAKRKIKRSVFPVADLLNKFDRNSLLKIINEMTDFSNRECITLEPFDEMEDGTLQTLVYISKTKLRKTIKRVHVFTCESLYTHCVTRMDFSLKPNNPLNPGHTLSDIDIQFLQGLCNITRTPRRVPINIDLVFVDLFNDFSSILIRNTLNNSIILHLGVLPNDIEPEETISLDICTSVVMTNLKRLWDEGRFLDSNNPPYSANWFPRHTILDYIDDEGKLNIQTFIDFAEKINHEVANRNPNNA